MNILSLLGLTTLLVAATLISQVLGGPYAHRPDSDTIQNNRDAYYQIPSKPLLCPFGKLRCSETSTDLQCKSGRDCKSFMCCEAEGCPPNTGLCHINLWPQADRERKEKQKVKVQTHSPESCSGPLKQCTMTSQFCHNSDECGSSETCCESVCGYGVCSSAAVEEIKAEKIVEVQGSSPESCPGPLKQCTMTSQFCHDSDECGASETCCESVCGFGVCSSTEEEEIEVEKKEKQTIAAVDIQSNSPENCGSDYDVPDCVLGPSFGLCMSNVDCIRLGQYRRCCAANCSNGYGICSPLSQPNYINRNLTLWNGQPGIGKRQQHV